MTGSEYSVLSKRGNANVEAIMPKIKGQVAERVKENNTNIDLSTAENWFIRSELIDICKEIITQELRPEHFSYPRGFSGDPYTLDSLANFFNSYFAPHVPVEPSHLALAPGAASSLDALFYNICNPGDGILLPGPYWNGFDFQFQARSSVTPIVAQMPHFSDSLSEGLIPALRTAYNEASCPVRALLLTNPHNPLGVRYSRVVLEACLQLCQDLNIYFISDEVYALTSFETDDIPFPIPFTSLLSLDVKGLGCDLWRAHTVWSTSKDFGQSGFRLGCTVTQANEKMAVGLALAANTQVSALTSLFVGSLLQHPSLPVLIETNKHRLRYNYELLTHFFKKHHIPYVPCNASLYVFAQLAVGAQTWAEEKSMVRRLRDAGVLVSAGSAYHVPEANKGWMRVGFAVDTAVLEEAIERMKGLFEIAESRTNGVNEFFTKRARYE